MNQSLSAKWRQLEIRANGLSVRERMIVAGAVAVLLLGAFDQLLLRPWLQARGKLEQQQQTLAAAAEKANEQIAALERRLAADPNQLLREKINELNARHAAVDADIAHITDGMIAPERMAPLLGELLSERSGLSVQSIRALPAQPVLSANAADRQAPAMYRHDLELRLQGSFAQAFQYLQSIEQLPSRMIWDALIFEVERYPQGQLTLAVHTLSTQEELIRVRR